MLVYLNGRLLPRREALIDCFDRGFILGDGVYEGLRAIPAGDSGRARARIVGLKRHVRRMQLGLDAAKIGVDARVFEGATDELLSASGLTDAFVYWHVTGGVPGEHDPLRSRVPGNGVMPTVFAYAEPRSGMETIVEPPTKKVITCRDVRWELGWLKSISLMGNVWAAKLAAEHGAEEAILIRHADGCGAGDAMHSGVVSEGLATNVVMALPNGAGGTEVVTPSLESAPMLAGVTRDLVVTWAPEIVQRRVSAEELERASEIMLLGTTTYVSSVVEMNGRTLGDGRPGPVSRRLLRVLKEGIAEGRDIEA